MGGDGECVLVAYIYADGNYEYNEFFNRISAVVDCRLGLDWREFYSAKPMVDMGGFHWLFLM